MKRILTLTFSLILGQFVIGYTQIDFPFIIQGEDAPYGGLGMCVYGKADINMDGQRDLLATTLDAGPFIGAKIFVYSGKDFSTIFTFSHRISGDNYGLAAIDANLDKVPDIVVPGMTYGNDDNDTSFIIVYSEKDGSTLYRTDKEFRVTSVTSISDLNSDGIGDLLAGGRYYSDVLSGKDGSLIHRLPEPAEYGAILALEDINGDQTADIAVCSDRLGSGGSKGTITIFSGFDGSRIRTIIGTDGGFAHMIAACPDKDGDGKEDLVVARTSKDTVYVYSTSTGQKITEIGMPFGDPGSLGTFIGNLGDLNGDGYDDIVISDPLNSADSGFFAAGVVFILSGANFALINSFYGVEASWFGLSATSLGDLNGDGRIEIAVGAPGDNRVYVFSMFTPGDANQDGKVNLVDIIIKVNHVFKSWSLPLPASASDDNCDGRVNLDDIWCNVNYIFREGTPHCCQK